VDAEEGFSFTAGEEIGEYVCAENNQDVQHMVGK